jgi:radical SAM superfamily enzyme YgiQ (UPF0313 family)
LRIMLAQPPLSIAREVTPPLGLCTLAAWLQSFGHEVRITDLDLEVKEGDGGGETYLSLFEASFHGFAPQMLGVTSMYNNSLQGERLIRLGKRLDPSVVTVAGGSHFGALGSAALDRVAELDFVVRGEGETALAGLAASVESSTPIGDVPGICYHSGDLVVETPSAPLLDLSALPPVWTMLKDALVLERYAATIPDMASRRSIYVEAGRGCPFACTFCATSPFWQRRFRVKPVDRVVDEIQLLHEDLGYDSFMLVHDLLTVSKTFVSKFCEALLSRRLSVQWMANHRTDLSLTGLLPKMRAAGCWKLFVGVESGSERIQSAITKRLRPDEVMSSIAELADHGISATCSFIIGFPDEIPAELSATVSLGARLKLLSVETVQFHRLRTWPPAPLALERPPAEFDLDSLLIEYPFVPAPEGDVEAIRSDPVFFAGYFAPNSRAGTFAQLAQAELFFSQTTAIAPFTICAVSHLLGESLIDSFYHQVADAGLIHADDFDAATFDLGRNWSFLHPIVEDWVAGMVLPPWQRRLVSGLLEYESHRVGFVVAGGPSGDPVASGTNWGAYVVDVDVPLVVQALRAGTPLSPRLLNARLMIFVARGSRFVVYSLDPCLQSRLERRDADLVALFESGSTSNLSQPATV